MSKLRCSSCREYFDRTETFRVVALARFCSEGCYSDYLYRRRPQRATPPPSRARKASLPLDVRRNVRARDGQVCRFCGQRGQQVHHIQYRSSGGSDEPSNLILLCDEHHTLVHSNKRVWQPILFGVVWMGYVEASWLTVPQFMRRFRLSLDVG